MMPVLKPSSAGLIFTNFDGNRIVAGYSSCRSQLDYQFATHRFEGSQDYDLALRYTSVVKNKYIRNIPEILYYWRADESSTARSPTLKEYATSASLKALRE